MKPVFLDHVEAACIIVVVWIGCKCRMQVQHSEKKTGFECIHLPSIDFSSIDPTLKVTHSSANSSFFNVPPSNHTAVAAQGEKGTAQTNGSTTAAANVDNAPAPTPHFLCPSPHARTRRPTYPERFCYASVTPSFSTQFEPVADGKGVFETMGNTSLSVRFEINFIKVGFLYIQLMFFEPI